MRLTIAFGLLISASVLIGCGGGSSGGGGTVTSPTPATVTVADAAPALGEEIAIAVNAALRAGTAAAQPPGLAERLLQLFAPTLHAQSAFVANCRRGGNVNIRYTGSRPVVLAGTSVVFSNCTVSVRNRDVAFNADLNGRGYWTAQDPGPVVLNGNLNVNEIGTQLLNGSVTNTQFGGTIGGITVGTPDTNPPPSPNTCPGPSNLATIQAPSGGGTFSVSIAGIGATCPWSVTSGPSWVNVTSGTGRGPGTVTFTVAANGETATRTGTLVVNNQNVTINQSGAAPPPPAGSPFAAAVGQWSGTITGNNPCSVGNPTGTYNWTGTLSLSGSTFSMVWRDSYFGFTRTFTFPAANTISFTVRDDPDVFNLTGTFASDFQSLNGTLTASIDCVTSVRPSSGTWTGRRTGP